MAGPIEEALRALNAAEVRYLVTGGVAVVLHGYLRTTADLDLWVQLEPENLRHATRALGALGYRPRAPVKLDEFADPAKRREWIEEKGLVVFSLWNPSAPLEIDLFVKDPFDFGAAWARAVRAPLETTDAMVVALEDLIAMKQRVGRPRDLEDVEALRALRDASG
ncbi:MAG: nucleotidyl transferase AbiEii/AbiGii toxin family protein [Candidatus Eiseniibacteriota bacterium]